ncbi:unnamed protein product [Ilex paraguariensis]|uniref:Histone-lysine N-methyltransferase SUVR5 n=1 Tax=Ilex paraguariensis TaxID=185542 RepID=A0ABC8UWX2_9AQUA
MMEVLPCSGKNYVGESDCPQQRSETGYMYAGKSNCLGHEEQVQMADIKVDDLMIDVEGPQGERQGGGQLTVDEFPTSESHYNGDPYDVSQMDGQKSSSDFHDSEDDTFDAQDNSTGPGVAPDNSPIIVDTIESGLQSNMREGESFISELKWLEQDEPMAVWVKWRGKWQAGIRCARVDWPLSTLKAKPTHDRKQYLVIFFPRTRNYSWADVLLVRPISDIPQPIAYGTHKVGVKMVKDLTLARRFILQKLSVSMLNIIDQLRSEALIETARNVMIWKEFAMEASRCKGYSDLGRMLVKLQNMILLCYLSTRWLQHSLQSWVQRCQNANSAEFIEMLKEELVDSILWNEVNSLSDVAAQPEFGSEWKTWKQDVMKCFSMSHQISNDGGVEQQGNNDTPLAMGFQVSRKRPKLEVRRAEAYSSQVEIQGSHQAIAVEIDSGFFEGSDTVNVATLASERSRNEILLEGAAPTESPGIEADRWGEIVVEAGNSDVLRGKDVESTPSNGVVARKSLDPGNKNRQCIAFIEAKGRQCVRWANDGDVYCCIHLASRFVGNSAKAEAIPPVDAPMCEGTTVLGTKCKHRSLHGSSFCKKHRPRDDIRMTLSSPDDKVKRKLGESIERSETTYCKEIVLAGEGETPLQVDPISFMHGEAFNGSRLIEIPEQSGKEYSGTETVQCVGSDPHDGCGPCLENPKRHSLYCEKHLPSWLKRARNGKSRIISKEVFLELLRDCYSREQRVHLHQACELFYRLFKSILSLRNPVPKEVQFQWAISEASKDVGVGEFLTKLVCSEKERLKRLWGFNPAKDTQASSFVEEPIVIPMVNNGDNDNENVIKCKMCSEKFLDDQALGTHWMGTHKKEAQWLFRGYVCAICLDSFTNKKVLETHVQERHRVQFVEQCMLFQCIPCGSHFGNPEQLWLHVLSVHPANFRLSNAAQQHNLSVGQDSWLKLEPSNSVSAENINSENQGGARKFICRFCGLKFDLLPDLGRHHQAAHMGPHSVGPRLPKRGIHFYAHKLKSGRLTRPRFNKSLGAASYRIRNRVAASMKKRIEASDPLNTVEVKVQSHATEAANLGRLAESQCSAVAKILFSEIKKTRPRPSHPDILSVARSACCKVNLQASLDEKYGVLPERIYLKAAKLCSEHNILVDWHQEGFVCPKGCKPIVKQQLVSPLMPLSDGAMRPRTELLLDPGTNEWVMDECHYVIDSHHFRLESIDRGIILCDDISFGQESVPITCLVDENLLGSLYILADGSDGQTTAWSMPWESFTYVMKPVLDQSLGEAESLQFGCACAHSTCSSQTCDHVYLFDNDYEDAKDIFGNPMHGRFPYDEKGRIILEEGYLVYECNQRCSCSRTCQNRVLQNGVRVKLEVFKTEKKGWAVRAGEAILRGTFVCEYIGEVIDEQEANKRRNRYGREAGWYFYEIDGHINDMSRLIEGQVPYVIDATNYGNVSRYINHR